MARENRFASEKYEAGNANMEYDAALDAMTIDPGHENSLGMEGVDNYQMKLAQLSSNMDLMDTAGGIDYDGDGQVDVTADKPGAMMKYTEEGAFKVQFVPTGISMGPGGDPKCPLPDYGPEVNGIVPGYAGHIPRARDKYGGSAHVGCSLQIHGHKHIGPQADHDKLQALGNRFGNDGLPLTGAAVEPRFENFKERSKGVMPGYGGFRPGAREECGVATYGGVVRYGKTESRAPHECPKPGFVDHASGVLPGYTGYVPASKNTHGVSHYGAIGGGHHGLPGAGAQLNHGNQLKGDRQINVAKTVKSGYSGHIPQARDTFGGAHYGVGSHASPSGYKKAAPVRHNQDMRLVTGSDAGNSEYAADGGGGVYGADRHLATFHNYATDDEPPPSQVAGGNAAKIAAMQGIGKKPGMLSY